MRRGLITCILVLALAAPAVAQESDARRNDMANTMRTLGADVLSGSKLDQAIAAADQHPLGTKENPVRSDGPPGQRAYIARLRCGDGSRPEVGTRFNVGEGPYNTIVDVYPLQCGNDGPAVSLHMDMYFRHVEDRPLPGFSIQPTAIDGSIS